MSREFRLDEVAREAGVASTTVRLYQNKGLLAPPRLAGRTGWYTDAHVRRIRLITRLQEQGFSLAGIGALLDQWTQGGSLDALIGVEDELDALIGDPHALVLTPAELAARLPEGALQPERMSRSLRLGLVEATADGNFRVADARFLDTGAALARMGIPMDDILDEWEALVAHTDDIARRFVALFEAHLAPDGWQTHLDAKTAQELANTLLQLRTTARQIVLAALETSIARTGRDRFSELVEQATVSS